MNQSNSDAPVLLRLPVVEMPAPSATKPGEAKPMAREPVCSYCGVPVRPDGYCKPCMKWGAE